MDNQTKLILVEKLTKSALSVSEQSISFAKEQGNVNTSFEVVTPNENYILRIRFLPNEMRQFEAEKLCAELVRDDLGEDWTPRVIKIGQFEGVSPGAELDRPSKERCDHGSWLSAYSGD